MARSSAEKAFSDAVGRICEDEIAPVVLRSLCDPGTWPINLNKVVRLHHKWADWAIWRHNILHIVAVRGRIRWQKPQESHFRKGVYQPLLNGSFNGQGERLRNEAIVSVQQALRCAITKGAAFFEIDWQTNTKHYYRWAKDGEEIESLWLSVPVDIDGRYDAYWGPATEMREVKRKDVTREPGLAAPMSADDMDRYTRKKRRLIHLEAHSFPWQMGGHWACNAHEHWLRLDTISDRDKRIVAAIQATAVEIINDSRPNTRSGDDELGRSHPERGSAVPFEQRRSPASETKTVRMARRIRQGDLPCECFSLLRVLAKAPARFWGMPEIATGMRTQVGENGRPYRNDRYNESTAALEMTGLVRSCPAGRALLRQITQKGLEALKRR